MSVVQSWHRLGFGWRVATLTLVSGLFNLALYAPALSTWSQRWLTSVWPGLAVGQVVYMAFVFRTFLLGLNLVLLVVAVVLLERPGNIRRFLKLGPWDWQGLGLIILLTGVLDILEVTFLRRTFYDPVRLFLNSLGLRGQPPLDIGLSPDPNLVGLNLALLLLISWIEFPEELFFRGYVQNHLQEHIGPNAALFAGAIIWDAWHFFDPAEFVRRLFFGLAFSFVFRLRQNTTPLAIWHPLGNRLLLLAALTGPWLSKT